MTATLLGIDVGTTAVKAILFDADGNPLETYAAPYPTERMPDGRVEQDCADWIHHIEQALQRFAAAYDLTDLRAIGLTSQVNTHVFVGADGEALAPAIVWQDGRCRDEAVELDRQIDPDDSMRWWGGPRPVDASHCLSRALWMQRHHPDIWEKTRWVMLPKDYCILKLTGETVGDAISHNGILDSRHRPIEKLLDLVPGAAERMVPIAPMTDVAGTVSTGFAAAGTPVAVGTMDAWAGMFGAGVERNGRAMYLSGTSEILGIVSDQVEPTPGVIVFPPYAGLTVHAGPTQSGGASLLWLSRLFDATPAALIEQVTSLDFSRPCPLFLPHLQGERAPIWDLHSRGTFLGIDTTTRRADLARSVLEGVACSAEWLLRTLEMSARSRPETLHCGGGGFRADIWNQIRADILDRRLQRLAVSDPGVLGAAGIAAVASGLVSDLTEAFSRIARFDRVYEPNPARREHYDRLSALYRDAYRATSDVNHRIVGLYADRPY